MRRFVPARVLVAVGMATLCAATLLTGCAQTETAPPREGPGAFPVTIDHRYGSTTIEHEPQRVVTIGFQEHDFVLALGVAPVGARYWYGPEDDVIQPWAEPAADRVGADPTILNMESLSIEAVAALRPDLILGLYSGITGDEYERLSRVAPTVAQPAEYVDYGVPWQETTRIIGTALGRADRADRLVGDVEARFAATREANPQFEGRSVVVAAYGSENVGVFASQDPRSRFFTELGFRVPQRFDDLARDLFYATLSFEQIPLLDTDLLVWDQTSFTPDGRATIERDPLVRRLAATTEERSIFMEGQTEAAFGWNTVLSLPRALDGIEPLLRRAQPPTR